jgi:hypothetical protein
MARNRKLFLGNPPFQFLVAHLAQDEDFLNDARSILELDQEECGRLASRLGRTDLFLDRPSLFSLVSEIIGDQEKAQKIASIIYRVGGMLHDADIPATEAMDELGRALQEKADGIEPEDRRTLVQRLRSLSAEPIGLAKQYKARRLVDATGSKLDEFQIICDVRPIFDQSRERIEGAIPLAILRLEYSSPDRESAVVEMRITEKQLEDFRAKIETAHRKLKLIKVLLVNQRLPVPRTGATVTEEE